MKFGYWQIQIAKEDKQKTTFTVPFGYYEQNIMPFELKSASTKFQKIMNDIFNADSVLTIAYIDNVLVLSKIINQHFKHLKMFIKIIKSNGLVVSTQKIKLFQIKIRFQGHNIEKGTIILIDRIREFADKFHDEIRDKIQLQRFLGSFNYVSDFYKSLTHDAKPLFQKLKKNPLEWTKEYMLAMRKIKDTEKSSLSSYTSL